MPIINWIKNHKLLVILVLIIAFLLRNSFPSPIPLRSTSSIDVAEPAYNTDGLAPYQKSMSPEIGMTAPNYQKMSDSSQRVFIKESNLSLLVKNVRESGDQIISYSKTSGGYMVDSSYNNPGDQAFATVTVRVPTDRLDSALSHFRSLAIKVSSENLAGTDVTDAYQDLDQQIATLKTTKTKFEEILKKAATVSEILEVNREIINMESQIDSATGQKMALADNAKLTKITLFLSTDELALPYTPDKAFRPDVIFKLAVRQLFATLQSFAELIIWAAVFAVIWIPLLAMVILFKRWRKGSKPRSNTASQQSKIN